MIIVFLEPWEIALIVAVIASLVWSTYYFWKKDCQFKERYSLLALQQIFAMYDPKQALFPNGKNEKGEGSLSMWYVFELQSLLQTVYKCKISARTIVRLCDYWVGRHKLTIFPGPIIAFAPEIRRRNTKRISIDSLTVFAASKRDFLESTQPDKVFLLN